MITEIKKGEIIKEIIDEKYGINTSFRTRRREFCQPRQMAQYFIFTYTKLTNQKNADFFKQDHSSINNSIKVVKNLYDTDSSFKKEFNDLEKEILAKIKHKSKYISKREFIKYKISKQLNNQNLTYIYNLSKILENKQTKLY